ncbi:MAG: hypothetical protein FWC40_05000 [Proteobacteria bacterium]|nr:hypothetical protein [Pseudomonadota bacterium]
MKKNAKKSRQRPAKHPPRTPAEAAAHPPLENSPPSTPTGIVAMVGRIDGVRFQKYILPAMQHFDQHRKDDLLRQLVENVAMAIAMHDAYADFRKIDDISQRYLYYLESFQSAPPNTTEALELGVLRDYWRSQVFMTFIRDAGAIFALLDDLPTNPASACLIDHDALLTGLCDVVTCRVGGHTGQTSLQNPPTHPILDFVLGTSTPWIGFLPEHLFGLLHATPETTPPIAHEFALAMPEHVAAMRDGLRLCIEESLLIDLILAQHPKLHAEIRQAFDDDERLPTPLLTQLKHRVRFDRVYQTAFDAILTAQPVQKPLHRASRLSIPALNAVGALYAQLNDAASQHHAVYIFHYWETAQTQASLAPVEMHTL